MGYAYYRLADGREAGYGVGATCDEGSCTAGIDRGLAYLCGESPGGDEWGCGGYFCYEHLFYVAVEGAPQLCPSCSARLEADSPAGGGV
jgi:hypothetical protein